MAEQIQVTIDPASVSQALHKRIAEIAIGEEIAKAIASACDSYKVRASVEEAVKQIVAREISMYISNDEKMRAKIKELISNAVTEEAIEKMVNSVWESTRSRW
jgi:uncharacterized membrane-anchored protein YjiN (DUF445 family)